MNREELDNQFDVLYNSITSNQAPGLDVYEKSVFLTKAEYEILLSYFDPRTNKVLEGFDGSERRQIDFSMVTKSKIYENKKIPVEILSGVRAENSHWDFFPFTVKEGFTKEYGLSLEKDHFAIAPLKTSSGNPTKEDIVKQFVEALDGNHPIKIVEGEDSSDNAWVYIFTFYNPVFDLRDNTVSVTLEEDILSLINESAIVSRGDDKQERLVVIPIHYQEYSRTMSKPYKRPLKYQAWRLIDNTDSSRRSEIIVGPSDTLEQYVIRYIRKPLPIILGNLDGLTINNYTYEEVKDKTDGCELDSILHQEILQRAVELAKAAYAGDLSSSVNIGNTSSTQIGVLPQSNNK